ncbi:hypothetical protein AJ80_08361 [Polytolypa hystricis UAMH7299]|uniref:Uncharacterized protein n=1 Tax=Polytolypa hystricis (strain UAMH7299) TaxID=1447883 RepID=A0A2B7X8Z9_POLH7|nr:hypothetical protein AJ80_08361 [Polytolypa hystricis UAMH7299]
MPVDLFHSGIDPALETKPAEEYSVERVPDDGQIYYKICKYQGYQGLWDPFLENQWWAHLGATSETKRDNMTQIIKSSDFRAQFVIGNRRIELWQKSERALLYFCNEPNIPYLTALNLGKIICLVFCLTEHPSQPDDTASLAEALVDAFNWRLEHGLRRGKSIDESEARASNFTREEAPGWTAKVASLVKPLNLIKSSSEPHNVFLHRNIRAGMGYLYTV